MSRRNERFEKWLAQFDKHSTYRILYGHTKNIFEAGMDSMKLQMPTTTLICVDCRDVTQAIKAMNRCTDLVKLGDVKLLTHLTTDYPHKVEIQNLSSLVMYSIFCLKELYKHIDTEHLLIVQADGWILNPTAWKDEWYQYDYIGAVFNQQNDVGNGGFSFRSKRLMEFVASRFPEWDGTEANAELLQSNIGYYEDGAISLGLKHEMESQGFKIAPTEVGAKFAAGGNPNYYEPFPFGFHGSWSVFNQHTGFVEKMLKHDGYVQEPI